MQYLSLVTSVDDLQKTLDGIEVDFKVRQLFQLVNDPRFLIFAERRSSDKGRHDQHADVAKRSVPRINFSNGGAR